MGELSDSARASPAGEELTPVHVWHGVSDIPSDFGPTVVTIGNFDGVHLGHRRVLERARDMAGERGLLPVVAVTFDPHPLSVIVPARAPQALIALDRRIVLLHRAGADAVLVLPFTAELAKMSAEAFVVDILLDALRAQAIVVGENFHFGYRAQGTVGLLTEICAARGVAVAGLPLDGSDVHSWSSSYIRRCIAAGDVEAAAEALGRPFTIRGTVVRGDQRGRELGYPTANVPVADSLTAVPADGVYAGWLRLVERLDSEPLPAAISVGSNPTFDGTQRRVESYVLDRTDLELYGVAVEVAFVAHLRGMVRFDSVEDLTDQMKRDVDQARELLVTPPVEGR